MTQEITLIPDNLPAYLQGADFSANDEALSNLSLGGYPYIKLNGTRFQAVEGDAEHNLPVLELPVVIMRAAPALRKKWYATKYDPNNADPTKKPDCFSDDGITPHAGSVAPQCKTCAACAHNAFGSGRDQNGKPTDGKACSDNKLLAIYTKAPSKAGAENDIFGLRLPPASLKNFAMYAKGLTAKRVPIAAALTIIGFDQAASYPVLTFRFGGLLNEAQYAAIAAMAKGDEVEAILAPTPGTGTALPAAATPPPVPAQAAPPVVAEISIDDLGLGGPAPVATQPTTQPAAAAPAAAPVTSVVDDDMFGDLAPVHVTAAPAAQSGSVALDLPDENDDDLAKSLGL